jgi:hypothetical protein
MLVIIMSGSSKKLLLILSLLIPFLSLFHIFSLAVGLRVKPNLCVFSIKEIIGFIKIDRDGDVLIEFGSPTLVVNFNVVICYF